MRRRGTQAENAGEKCWRETQEGGAGGKCRRGHRRGMQEGGTGKKRRRGTQEGNAGEKCRRGKPELSAGGECQSGAQEGSVGGGSRRGISGVARISAGGFCCWGPLHVLGSLQGGAPEGYIRHPPGGVAVGGHRMPCGASYVGVTTLIPEPPFPLLLFTKCFCVPSWSTVYTAPAWNPYSQVLICKINPLDLQALCGEIPVILVRCWINCSAQYWKPSLFCFFFFLHKIHTGIVYLLILFCMTRVKGIQNTLGRFSAIFKKGDSFVTSCLVSCTYKELLMLGLYHPR